MNTRSNALLELLRQLDPHSIFMYLEKRGWSSTITEHVTVLIPPKLGIKAGYMVPLDPTYSDFHSRLQAALLASADLEGIPLSTMLQDLQNLLVDPVSPWQPEIAFRIGLGDQTSSIPVIALESIVSQLRQGIAHSLSCELEEPVPYRAKVGQKAADMAKAFEFGQTRVGSFIGVIRTPRIQHSEPSLFPNMEKITPETRGIARIARGLELIAAKEVSRFEDISTTYETGLNANIARHLINTFEAAKSRSISFQFGFNSTLRKALDISSINVEVDRGIALRLEFVEKLFKTNNQTHAKVIGRIVGLDSKDPQQTNLQHFVKVVALTKQPRESEVFSGRTFSLGLTNEQYRKAAMNHIEGRVILVEGDFEIQGNKLVVKKIADVSEFDPETDPQ